MVETWMNVASWVMKQAPFGLKSEFEFATPIEIEILDYQSYNHRKKKILVKKLETRGCNFTQNLEMSVIDIDGNSYGCFQVDCGIFQIWRHINKINNQGT